MAGTDDQDLDLDGQDGDEGDSDDGSDTGDGDAGDKDGKPEGDGTDGEDKRLKDLQSKADKAEARANKAEAALAKSLKSGEGEGSKDPERAALLEELREASLDAVYGEFEQLREYGIDRALIEGQTRAEMRESATSLVGLIKSVATKARNKALKEAGVTAEPAGSTRTPPKDFGSMSAEEFEQFRAERKGSDLWR
jgi:hypothetical protein